MFDHPDFDGHEEVLHVSDPSIGLEAIIAVHDTTLGPAAGGCRMYPYATPGDALTDVLRLSRGMTYKNAIAGLELGGGKCVIIADPASPAKHDLLRAFSEYVQRMDGRYWTAIDVGVGPVDADVLAERCDYIFANAARYQPGFNPSTFTALGGFSSLRGAVAHVLETDDLTGLRVAIQGLGATGAALAGHLHEAGAELVVADVRDDAVADMVDRYGATAVHVDDIHRQAVDVFAPCALGAGLNDQTIPELQTRIVCGMANNQLAEERHGAMLRDRDIAYVPDYLANCGGVTGAAPVIYSDPSPDDIDASIRGLRERVIEVLQRADETGEPTSTVANQIARERIDGAAS